MTTEAKRKYMREYQKRYRAINKERLQKEQKEYYKKNKKRVKQYAKGYYQRNKDKANAKSTLYRLVHRVQVNEWNRKHYHKGTKVPKKSYSFYRDFIKFVDLFPHKTVRTTIFRTLLALPLTPRQKKLVVLAYAGYSQPEIAQEMGVTQSSVCKTWNGSSHHISKRMHGGIHNKFLKYLKKEKNFRQYLDSLQLKWSKDGNDGNTREGKQVE